MNATASYLDTGTQTAHGANNIAYAYRRLGPLGGRPLVLLQHFRGNLENWDPDLIDDLSTSRDVIVFDNVGVGATTGLTPTTIGQMADDAIVFLDALGLDDNDLLGSSIGSFVAQEIALTRSSLVHRLILASTAPQGRPACTAGHRTSSRPSANPGPTPRVCCAFFTGRRPAGTPARSSSAASSPGRTAGTGDQLADAQRPVRRGPQVGHTQLCAATTERDHPAGVHRER